jgi:hypothetical protein
MQPVGRSLWTRARGHGSASVRHREISVRAARPTGGQETYAPAYLPAPASYAVGVGGDGSGCVPGEHEAPHSSR